MVKEFLICLVAATMEALSIFCFFVQTSMSAKLISYTTVIGLHSALTQLEVLPASATLATLEMANTAQV